MTPPQCMEALDVANRIRCAQAEVLREIRRLPSADAKTRAARYLSDPDETVGGIRIDRFLKAVPRVGEHKLRTILNESGLHGTRVQRRIRDLTERERKVLAGALLWNAVPYAQRRTTSPRELVGA